MNQAKIAFILRITWIMQWSFSYSKSCGIRQWSLSYLKSHGSSCDHFHIWYHMASGYDHFPLLLEWNQVMITITYSHVQLDHAHVDMVFKILSPSCYTFSAGSFTQSTIYRMNLECSHSIQPKSGMGACHKCLPLPLNMCEVLPQPTSLQHPS